MILTCGCPGFCRQGTAWLKFQARRSVKTIVARKTGFDNTSDVLSLTLDTRLEGRSCSYLNLVRRAVKFCMFVHGALGLPVVDYALTLSGKKILCRSLCWLQTNIYDQEKGTMQAPETIESSQPGLGLLVIRTCLRCEETSKRVGTDA